MRNLLDVLIPMAVYAAILQNAGLPPVNWMYVGVAMFLLFGLGQMLAWHRYR